MIKIYGITFCNYCTMAKKLCEEKGIDYVYHDMDKYPLLIDELRSKIGPIKSAPQIFDDINYIGGYTELKEYLSVKE